jgi:hypothetical protein
VQHGIDQGRLAVVDVGDDRHVTQVRIRDPCAGFWGQRHHYSIRAVQSAKCEVLSGVGSGQWKGLRSFPGLSSRSSLSTCYSSLQFALGTSQLALRLYCFHAPVRIRLPRLRRARGGAGSRARSAPLPCLRGDEPGACAVDVRGDDGRARSLERRAGAVRTLRRSARAWRLLAELI